MSDPDFDPCSCYLFNLRPSQEHCSEAECYSPQTLPGPGNLPPCDTNDFMMVFMFVMIGLLLYFLRPKSIRQASDNSKGGDSDSDFNGEPPLPPPAVN